MQGSMGQRQGLEEARERFDAMYRRCEQPVLAYAMRRAPAEVARDAAADAFVAAWRRFDELPPDPLPWLIGATRKTLANQRRATARQARIVERLTIERSDPALPCAPSQADPAVRRAFSRLAAADREALALIAWDGLTPTQAARSLDCSPVGFRVRLHRARRRFAHALRRESEAEARSGERDRIAVAMKEAS